jgi:hypothetical protein
VGSARLQFDPDFLVIHPEVALETGNLGKEVTIGPEDVLNGWFRRGERPVICLSLERADGMVIVSSNNSSRTSASGK